MGDTTDRVEKVASMIDPPSITMESLAAHLDALATAQKDLELDVIWLHLVLAKLEARSSNRAPLSQGVGRP